MPSGPYCAGWRLSPSRAATVSPSFATSSARCRAPRTPCSRPWRSPRPTPCSSSSRLPPTRCCPPSPAAVNCWRYDHCPTPPCERPCCSGARVRSARRCWPASAAAASAGRCRRWSRRNCSSAAKSAGHPRRLPRAQSRRPLCAGATAGAAQPSGATLAAGTVATLWRDLLLLTTGSAVPLVNSDREESLRSRAAQLQLTEVRVALNATRQLMANLRTNMQLRLALEVMLLEYPGLQRG